VLEAHSAYRASALERDAESSPVCSAYRVPVLGGLRVGGMAVRLVQIAMNAWDDSALGQFWA